MEGVSITVRRLRVETLMMLGFVVELVLSLSYELKFVSYRLILNMMMRELGTDFWTGFKNCTLLAVRKKRNGNIGEE